MEEKSLARIFTLDLKGGKKWVLGFSSLVEPAKPEKEEIKEQCKLASKPQQEILQRKLRVRSRKKMLFSCSSRALP